MNIYFQNKNTTLHDAGKNKMTQRLRRLEKFFNHEVQVYVDVEKTSQQNNGDDIFYASIRIDDPKNQYFTEEYEASLKRAFDVAYSEMNRMVRSHSNKSRNLARRAKTRIKKMFQRQK